ncbi:MAG: nuclear transport factor 2 family protein [Anaerolineae bacterium]
MTDTLTLIQHFHDALNRHDIDAMMALMSADCLFENTFPAPDGTRYEGQAAVRAFWHEFFTVSPQAYIAIEEIFALDNRAVIRWRYQWDGGHVRGVDIFRVHDGKITEKLSYVKG